MKPTTKLLRPPKEIKFCTVHWPCSLWHVEGRNRLATTLEGEEEKEDEEETLTSEIAITKRVRMTMIILGLGLAPALSRLVMVDTDIGATPGK